MNASAILEDLARRGVSIGARGDKLRIAPANAVSPELRSLLLQHKAEILALLCRNGAEAPTEPLPNLEAEEALYRLWWRTLPDKVLARRMGGHLTYWARERGLSAEAAEGLRDQVRDLLG